MSTLKNRLVVVGVAASVAAMSLVTPAAQAVTCQARNATSDGVVSADLQAVIDAANPGDTLHVHGLCTGGFVIDKDLRLSREPGAENAILDGGGVSTVLTITGTEAAPITVGLHGLRITNGSAVRGGGVRSRNASLQIHHSTVTGNQATKVGGAGIHSTGSLTLADTRVVANLAVDRTSMGGGVLSRGRLILKGHTSIIANKAPWGGGILASDSVLLLGRSEVARNTGGGISRDNTRDCTVSMNAASSVRGNVGTGIYACSPVWMNDRSSVTGNTGHEAGGIIANRVVMNDRARVSDNTAQEGGGIYASRVVMNDHARILRNTASKGGGVYVSDSAFKAPIRMNGSSRITSNTARQTGGGIYIGSYRATGDVILRGTAAVTRNVANGTGGGVLVWAWCPEGLGKVIVQQGARVRHNKPNNIAQRVGICTTRLPADLDLQLAQGRNAGGH